MRSPFFLVDANTPFPPVSEALTYPNGLLAVGGELSINRLKQAYQQGIFPWYTENQPILWWCPDPRAVIFLEDLKISRSLKKTIRHTDYQITLDKAFAQVISLCAAPRQNQAGTWLSNAMQEAYCQLHHAGLAHSVEVWRNQQLIGGLYGIDVYPVFSGESMFSLEPNAAKVALVYLTAYLSKNSYRLIDCQINNQFLQQLGAKEIPREEFIKFLPVDVENNPHDGFQFPTTLAKLAL